MSLQRRDDKYNYTYRRGQRVRNPSSTTNNHCQTQLHENGEVGCSNPPRSRRAEEENLPHLLQEIQDKLTRGAVECMICYDKVRRSAPVWSCSNCYSIFHLHCAKKWARAPSSVDLSAEKKINWRCPGCQSVQLTSSKEINYVCFCGKRPDPPCDFYLTPHSCGESCGKPLSDLKFRNMEEEEDHLCPHLCVLQCHPGPCPPCKAFAPPRLCPCGKQTITTRCSDRPTCGHHCNKLLQCARHRCQRICHLGPCDPCRLPINASCFCNKKMEVILCGDLAMRGEFEAQGGAFSCNSTCGKKLGCGNHACTETCHLGNCAECVSSITHVKTCCCGKTKLEEQRHSCLDPIPLCSQACGKSLPCGMHQCKQACHAGDCAPCLVLVSQRCRCGSISRTVECYKTTSENEKFTCEKPCGKKKNCGRHRCNEQCCPLSNPNADWDPHLCSVPCGKKLRCGQHTCESLCHRGYCPPCVETIFTDLTCACGKTSIPPPLPCGTPPPSCQLPCSVPQPCHHPASHNCHSGDCPPCTVPVAKECVGGHVVVRNMPCGSKDIRCNELCGKTRKCGLHACGKACHPPPCDYHSTVEGVHGSCGQTCGAPRKDCRHMCIAPCHPSYPCPDIMCQIPVTISCSCGRITANVPCGAGGSGSRALHEASIIQNLLLQPLDDNDKESPLGQRKLMCNDECAKLERKRVLAHAFEITSQKLDSLQFGENSESMADLLRRDSKWVLSIEERCKFLVLGNSRGTTTRGLKAHIFCPMLKDKRDAVRLIAERWKLSVSTGGWEAKSFVVVHVTQKSRPPARVLGVKGVHASLDSHPPAFDHLVDMDPRLVVSFPELPRGADISALVLRFGGECELVWLNDKNALAVFNDPARAATAMRRLDHGTVFQGAVAIVGKSSAANNAKRGATKGNSWKNVVGWGEDEDLVTNIQTTMWKKLEAPISASLNPWSVLDQVSSSSSSVEAEVSRKHTESSAITHDGGSYLEVLHGGNFDGKEVSGVVDDWEKACDCE